jgi:hypothetical protein
MDVSGKLRAASVIAVVAIALGGCSIDPESTTEEGSASDTTSEAASATTTEAPSTEGASVATSTPAPSDTLTRTVDDNGTVATITLSDALYKTVDLTQTKPTIAVPVQVTVTAGGLDITPERWKLRTLSGRTVYGSSASAITTAVGNAKIDDSAEGVVPFYDGTLLTDPQVSIAGIDFYRPIGGEPWASFDFPEPIKVGDIPLR